MTVKLIRLIGGKAMEKQQLEGLDIEKLLQSKPSKFVSTKEALKDVEPIQWSEDVISGRRKITISDKQ